MYQLSEHALRQEISGESVFLDMEKGIYFELNHTGNTILDKLLAGDDAQKISQWMAEEYQLDAETALADVNEVIQQLLEQKLIC
ncbi:MAG: PqqD family protein [bacterium]